MQTSTQRILRRCAPSGLPQWRIEREESRSHIQWESQIFSMFPGFICSFTHSFIQWHTLNVFSICASRRALVSKGDRILLFLSAGFFSSVPGPLLRTLMYISLEEHTMHPSRVSTDEAEGLYIDRFGSRGCSVHPWRTISPGIVLNRSSFTW